MDESRISGAGRPLRVVVGEDSSFMRTMIAEALESDPGIKVVGRCSDGQSVLRAVATLRPDCVTLDLEMPRMSGLETLRYLMSEWPTPVVIVSGYSGDGADLALTSLEYGAVDFIPKNAKGKRFAAEELVAKVRAAASVDVRRMRFAPSAVDIGDKPRTALAASLRSVVVIGASTGGPPALMELVPRLPRGIEAGIVIVQHMPSNFTGFLAERLDTRSHVEVREAREGDTIEPGHALVVPGGMHLFLDDRAGAPAVMLIGKNKLQRTACPSIDFTMTAFAPIFRERLIGVVLTGMGRDGAAGSAAVKRHGGTVICQDKESSLVFGMPSAVIGDRLADHVLPLGAIADGVTRIVRETGTKEPAHEHRRL